MEFGKYIKEENDPIINMLEFGKYIKDKQDYISFEELTNTLSDLANNLEKFRELKVITSYKIKYDASSKILDIYYLFPQRPKEKIVINWIVGDVP